MGYNSTVDAMITTTDKAYTHAKIHKQALTYHCLFGFIGKQVISPSSIARGSE